MAIFIAVIQIMFFSLAMAEQELTTKLHGQWYLVKPVHNATQCPTRHCMLWSQPLSRRDDYTYTPGIGSHKLHTRAVTWNEARLTCEEEGGHLAIINSIAEANVITGLLNNSEAIDGSLHRDLVSVGFHDLYKEGQFVTIHGQSLAGAGFTQWGRGQPSNSGGSENCGSLHQSGRLNDINCGTKCGFICEIPIY